MGSLLQSMEQVKILLQARESERSYVMFGASKKQLP